MAQERLIICNTSPMINLAEISLLESQARFWINQQLEQLLLDEAGEIG